MRQFNTRSLRRNKNKIWSQSSSNSYFLLLYIWLPMSHSSSVSQIIQLTQSVHKIVCICLVFTSL